MHFISNTSTSNNVSTTRRVFWVESICDITRKNPRKKRSYNLVNFSCETKDLDTLFKTEAHKDVTTANKILALLPDDDKRIPMISDAYKRYTGTCIGCRLSRKFIFNNIYHHLNCSCCGYMDHAEENYSADDEDENDNNF